MTPKSGKAIAWLSFLLGIAVSIAGNIGHAASDGMKPGEWAGAAFWPMALMLAIEILTRVRWQPGKRWTAAKVAGVLLVALVAAVLSYRHLAGLMTYWGEDWLNAHLGPLAVDGLMLIAATALLSISKESPQAVDEPVDEDARADARAEEQRQWWKEQIADLSNPVGIASNVRETPNGIEYDFQPLQDVDGPDLEPDEPAQEPSRLHVVNSVPQTVEVEAARQAWLESGGKLSAQQVADMIGVSKSTAHRKYTSRWASERRIIR